MLELFLPQIVSVDALRIVKRKKDKATAAYIGPDSKMTLMGLAYRPDTSENMQASVNSDMVSAGADQSNSQQSPGPQTAVGEETTTTGAAPATTDGEQATAAAAAPPPSVTEGEQAPAAATSAGGAPQYQQQQK
jgi:hypothetical protein